MSRIFETERFKVPSDAYELDRAMTCAMFRNNIRDWVLPNCVSRELFDKVHAENERLREEVAMMRQCIASTEDTVGQRE
jgi:hypothetical protein